MSAVERWNDRQIIELADRLHEVIRKRRVRRFEPISFAPTERSDINLS